ncbi:MAG: DNA alkylation repair protein [Thermoleophilaceae bacterium]|nr:DNA alkylation repair protein [Thermoleophilaceae bacterium]
MLQRFFKTGPGEYGEGDVFVGVKVPPLRALAKQHRDLPIEQIDELLSSPVHEHRMEGLIILTERARRADTVLGRELCDFYLARTQRVNNWDLVDVSCRDVVGGHLLAVGDHSPLKCLARSELIWDRRIAMVSTWAFIRANQLTPTFELAALLVDDSEDLIHKAIGWMLREAGKRDETALEAFLGVYASRMPRTALRYSIERMSPERRAYWRARK